MRIPRWIRMHSILDLHPIVFFLVASWALREAVVWARATHVLDAITIRQIAI